LSPLMRFSSNDNINGDIFRYDNDANCHTVIYCSHNHQNAHISYMTRFNSRLPIFTCLCYFLF